MSRTRMRLRFARRGRIARTAALGAFLVSLAGCGYLGGNPGVVYHGGMRYGPWWLAPGPVDNVAIGRPPGGVTQVKPAHAGAKAPKGSAASGAVSPANP